MDRTKDENLKIIAKETLAMAKRDPELMNSVPREHMAGVIVSIMDIDADTAKELLDVAIAQLGGDFMDDVIAFTANLIKGEIPDSIREIVNEDSTDTENPL